MIANQMAFRRILVVGTTGSGKTTTAGQLARRLGLPHVELDAINWGPNWTQRPAADFLVAVDQATSGARWVVDGNYSRVRPLLWQRADTVVWLDYPLYIILSQLIRRTFRRWWRREVLWSGNQERLRVHLASRDSLFLWALKTYRRRRRTYSALFQDQQNAHLHLVHLRSPRETRRWLAHI